MKWISRFLLISLLVLQACSSDRDVHRAFYYWKTEFRFDDEDSVLLADLKNDRLYLRLFDVSWDVTQKKAIPIGKLSFKDDVPSFLEVVPVVYITSETLSEIPAKQLPELSKNIFQLITQTLSLRRIAWKEIQLDCDWTDTNKEVFFTLLRELRKQVGVDKQLSCTIRLHQIKYPEKTGIPPVDRGMLMYYNMGNLNEPGMRNSIYDPDIAARYVTYVEDYPLPLDVALPVFTWGVHKKQDGNSTLVNNLTLRDVRISGLFREQASGLFLPMQGCFFRGDYFQEGDELRVEEINPELCKRAAEQVSPFLKSSTFHVVLFHLDSVNTARYGQKSFETVYSVFD